MTLARRSIRPLFLLFLGPLIQNAVIMTWANLMNFKATNAGCTPQVLCYIGICMAAGYTVSSFLAGRWVKAAFAHWLISIATIGCALLGLTIMVLPPFIPYLFLGFLFGLINGHYFCPFQVGMGSVKPFRTLAWTIAFYNVSWGTGVAIGPYIAGLLADLPKDPAGHVSKLPFLILAFGLAITHTILVLVAQSAPKPPPAEAADGADGAHAQPAPLIVSTRRLRRLGLLCSLVGQFLLTALSMSLWPPMAKAEGLNSYQTGLALFIFGLQIPIGGVIFATQRKRISKPWMLIVLFAVAALTFAALPYVTVWPGQLIVMGLIGFACSGLFFHGVYYPNADPENPRHSVSMMETTVGVAGFLGPLVMGNLAGSDALARWPYLVGAGLIFVVILIALRIWFNGEPRRADPRPGDSTAAAPNLQATSNARTASDATPATPVEPSA